MNHQLDFSLLSNIPVARRTDPITSHLAAKKITTDGTRASQQAAVHSWVRTYPGHTAQELAELCLGNGGSLDRYVFGRRLSEIACDHLRNGEKVAPLVKRGPKRICMVTGQTALTWWPYP